MEENNKKTKTLISPVLKGSINPILVLDEKYTIKDFNYPAAEFFGLDENKQLKDLLSENSYIKITGLIDLAKSVNEIPVYEAVTLTLKDLTEVKTHISINILELDQFVYIVIALLKDISKNEFNISSVSVRSGNMAENYLEKELRIILQELKNLYPFTVSGKDRFRKLIDEYEEQICLKESSEGKIILVNSAYARQLGVSKTLLEGKSEKQFAPYFISNIIAAIESYICETLNFVIIDGIPVRGITEIQSQQLIEIPVADYRDNVVAILGITQKLSAKKSGTEVIPDVISDKIIESLPSAIVFMDQAGIIRFASKEFCKLFSTESEKLSGIHGSQILPTELFEKTKELYYANITNSEFFSDSKFNVSDEENSEFRISAVKVIEPGYDGVLVYINPTTDKYDLNELLLKRGIMFEILIQKNPEPIFVYDADNLRFMEVNEAALNLYGYSKDEFLQMDLTDLYTAEDIQTLLGSSSEDDTISSFSGPFRHKTKGGSSVFVEISKTKFQFNGKDSYFNIVRNITERIELEKKNQSFKAAFENTDDIVLTTDSNGFTSYVNAAGINFLGFSENEILNISFASLVKDEDRAKVNTSVFSADVKNKVALELDIKKNDGSFISAEIIFSPVLDFAGQADSFTIIVKPIKPETDPGLPIKSPEADAESRSDVKEVLSDPDFLSGVFHELLTPMNVILGFAQELSDSIDNPSAEQKEASELITQNKTRLLNTMNSVVEYSELLQHKTRFNYSEISVTQLVEKIDNKITDLINTQDIEFSYGKISSSLTFTTDFQKFEILIQSLIKVIGRIIKEKKLYFSAFNFDEDNFIILISDKFNNCSEYLTGRIRLIYSGNNDLKDISVPRLTTQLSKTLLRLLGGNFIADNKFGCGFIFPLVQSQQASVKKYKSADQSVEEMLEHKTPESYNPFASEEELQEEKTEEFDSSQEVITESIQSENEEIEEIIPADEVESPEIESRVQPDQPKKHGALNLSELTCLYIEDQIDSQILFKVQMKGLKEIKFAVSFEEALPLLENRTFDFIVMDINLQGEYNGLDALKIINKMPGHENTPIIAVTAYVLPGDKEKFIATGFNDFVSKPIFREKMLESLERVFSK